MKKILPVVMVVAVVFAAWVIWANSAPVVTHMTVADEHIPADFEGFTVAQIADLHNAAFYPKIAKLLRQEEPDIIVFTGDSIDANHTDADAVIAMAELAAEIAPCYYVTGNHEAYFLVSDDDRSVYDDMEAALIRAGIAVLHNEKQTIARGDSEIAVIGVDDPAFMHGGFSPADAAGEMRAVLSDLMTGEERFTLLLSHRPELFDMYAGCGVGLAFTGHVHGGQFRLPFVGGLYGPGQGFLPEYDSGAHAQGDTCMIVSRGIGNSKFPLRFNNRPEIIVVELGAE